MDMERSDVPQGLRTWFVIHFVVDMVFAIPLLLFPDQFFSFFGWTEFDPITSRVVGAALLAIGMESFIGRNASRDVYKQILNLKVIWSSGTVLGIGLGIANGAPTIAWLFLVLFAAFGGVWITYWYSLRK